MNKEIVLPRPLMRIAIITSETAAGYGDFMNHIKSNGYGFRFNIKLFPAIMQGDKVETSVITALNCIAAEAANWDAVAIIRGGGAVSDLNGFRILRARFQYCAIRITRNNRNRTRKRRNRNRPGG